MGRAYRLLTLALLALVTIIAFEAMAISTAMPRVARDLNAVRSYGLAFSVMLTAEMLGIVLAGVWSDRRGPLPSLFAGQILMAAGSALAGLAPSFTILLAGRLIAGLGAGLIVVALYVVIGRAYPDALRPKVFSWISAAWVLPSLIGPPIAGWLASTWSWRWVFLIVLAPIAVTFAVVMTQRERINQGGATDQTERLAESDRSDRSDRFGRSGHLRMSLLGLGVALSAGAMPRGSDQLVPGPVPPVAPACPPGRTGFVGPRRRSADRPPARSARHPAHVPWTARGDDEPVPAHGRIQRCPDLHPPHARQ